jgi:integrase
VPALTESVNPTLKSARRIVGATQPRAAYPQVSFTLAKLTAKARGPRIEKGRLPTGWTSAEPRQISRWSQSVRRYYYPFHFFAHTGRRRGEALGLRWRDIDWQRNSAAIRQTVVPLGKASGTGREGLIVPRTKANKRG